MTDGKCTIEVKLECRGCGQKAAFAVEAPGIAWPSSGNMDPRYWTRFGNELEKKVEGAGWQAAPVWCPECIAKGLADKLEYEVREKHFKAWKKQMEECERLCKIGFKPYEHPMLKKKEE